MRKRTAAITIGGVLAGLALAACGSDTPDYGRICKEAKTNIRVDDGKCDNGGSGGSYVHTYIPSSQKAPAVGSHVTGGSSSIPAGKTYTSVPAKGGFGTHAGTSGS